MKRLPVFRGSQLMLMKATKKKSRRHTSQFSWQLQWNSRAQMQTKRQKNNQIQQQPKKQARLQQNNLLVRQSRKNPLNSQLKSSPFRKQLLTSQRSKLTKRPKFSEVLRVFRLCKFRSQFKKKSKKSRKTNRPLRLSNKMQMLPNDQFA